MIDAASAAFSNLLEQHRLNLVAALLLFGAAAWLWRVDKRCALDVENPLPDNQTRDDKQYTGFGAVRLRIVLVFAMALPMLVLYAISTLGPLLSQDLRFKAELLGYLIMSSFGIASLLSLWAGAVVDHLGSRYSLIMLFMVIAVAFTLIITADSFFGLIAAAAVCGIAQALANPVTNLLIAQQVPPRKKAGVVGLKQSGVQLAALFAGLVLPSVALAYGWRLAFGMIIPLALLFVLSAPSVTPRRHRGMAAGFDIAAPNALLLRLMSIQFCVGMALSAFVTFLPTFAGQQAMPLSIAGSLIAVFGVMGIVSRIVLTPLGAKLKDESYLLLVLIVVTALAMAVTMQATASSHWRLWFGAIGVGLSAVGTNAIAMSMLIRDAAFGAVTKASGMVSVAFFGGFAIGPPAYGNLVEHFGPAIGWTSLIGVLAIGCAMTLSLAFARKSAAGAGAIEQSKDEAATSLRAEVDMLKQQLEALESKHSSTSMTLSQLAKRLEHMEAINRQLSNALELKA